MERVLGCQPEVLGADPSISRIDVALITLDKSAAVCCNPIHLGVQGIVT